MPDDVDPDPWGLELVPVRSGERGDHDHRPDAPNAESVDLVKILAQLARTLDRVESRLSRIERAVLGGQAPGEFSSTMDRLRREPVQPASQPVAEPD